jgi:hypothetical protein
VRAAYGSSFFAELARPIQRQFGELTYRLRAASNGLAPDPKERLAEQVVVVIRPLLRGVRSRRRTLLAPASVHLVTHAGGACCDDDSELNALVTQRLCTRERYAEVLVPPPEPGLVRITITADEHIAHRRLMPKSATYVCIDRNFILVDDRTASQYRLDFRNGPIGLNRKVLSNFGPGIAVPRATIAHLRSHPHDPDALELCPVGRNSILVNGKIVQHPVVIRQNAVIEVGQTRIRLDFAWTWGAHTQERFS